MDDFVKSLVKRYEHLKNRRGNWDTHYQELADYMLPRKADIVRKRSRGEKRMELIFDGTALQSVDLLAASLHGMLTSGATPWFHLDIKDADLGRDDDVREWLQDTSTRMMRAFSHSNFETEVHEMYVDLVVFGTGCMFVENDKEALRFSTRHISEFYVQENQFGIVDTVFRVYRSPARQIVQRFGVDNVTDYILKVFQDKPDEEIEILHAVVPRINRDPSKQDNKNMPYASFYIDMQTSKLLSESGFQEFPYIVPRFLKATGETMGRSPAMVALPDVKMLNLMSKTIIQAAQKLIDPPLLVPDDGFLLPIRTQPGGLNFFRSGTRDMITPLNTGANIPIGLSMEEQRRGAIRSAFFVDQLLSGQTPNMTATEVVQRQEERMRVIGPVLGRLMNEMLRPLIDRVFALMLRSNLLAQPPEILQGRDVDIEYVSPLARAQKSTSLNSTMKALEILMPLAQSIPVGDHIDPDGLVRHVTDALGVPKSALRSDREVQQVREQRAQAEQEMMEQQRDQQEMAMAGQAAQAVRMVSK
ncbi:portal protein [Akkermansiaceae bacterium]|nr:portal protein [Akkermansiaceae bacterium]